MNNHRLLVKHFISEPIDVLFNKPPIHIKKPTCPDAFFWRNSTYTIIQLCTEWKDYSRSGKNSLNMKPEHREIAIQRGSWGVGKFYFDIETNEGKFFRLYYDRAPGDAYDRTGTWILFAELQPK